MRFIDWPLALTVTVFLAGAFIGAILVVLSSNIRDFAIILLQARMLSPVQAVSHLGNIAVFLLIFVNNCVPAVLSFIYPLVIARIKWTPPLTERRNFLFLSGYTFAAAFLIGFFSLGAPLATGWVLGGTRMLLSLIYTASVHGPLEFAVRACLRRGTVEGHSSHEGNDRRGTVEGLAVAGRLSCWASRVLGN